MLKGYVQKRTVKLCANIYNNWKKGVQKATVYSTIKLMKQSSNQKVGKVTPAAAANTVTAVQVKNCTVPRKALRHCNARYPSSKQMTF
jgi:hypothetical protein